MKAQNDLISHSAYIEDLYSKVEKKRERLDLLNDKLSNTTFMLQEIKKITDLLTRQIKNHEEILSYLNSEMGKKKSFIHWFTDLFDNWKDVAYLVFLFISFELIWNVVADLIKIYLKL